MSPQSAVRPVVVPSSSASSPSDHDQALQLLVRRMAEASAQVGVIIGQLDEIVALIQGRPVPAPAASTAPGLRRTVPPQRRGGHSA
ncbi:hypothetical protein AB0L40_18805 [Patulibacter sp. NPDC049589]|uniref:hypothetical protein n=1 Tax=Patulibacter sp. NPDC049589 TaxID=3154731 RepID=UPI00342DF034